IKLSNNNQKSPIDSQTSKPKTQKGHKKLLAYSSKHTVEFSNNTPLLLNFHQAVAYPGPNPSIRLGFAP
ncbi:MAG TPA: hypothetical protein VJT49_31405, partial [Amycolatopsis sp.]|uniref:hypothetical protein n=1 Tax=Amycolatopsis sp. TaxID=37632 RepID=UPI002B466547